MPKKRNDEIKHEEIKEVDLQVEHPDLERDNLRNVNYSPGENDYLNEGRTDS